MDGQGSKGSIRLLRPAALKVASALAALAIVGGSGCGLVDDQSARAADVSTTSTSAPPALGDGSETSSDDALPLDTALPGDTTTSQAGSPTTEGSAPPDPFEGLGEDPPDDVLGSAPTTPEQTRTSVVELNQSFRPMCDSAVTFIDVGKTLWLSDTSTPASVYSSRIVALISAVKAMRDAARPEVLDKAVDLDNRMGLFFDRLSQASGSPSELDAIVQDATLLLLPVIVDLLDGIRVFCPALPTA